MEIRDLMHLDASATAGNFTRAAGSLGISLDDQPPSRALRGMNSVSRFFERNQDGVRLSPGGKAVLPHIRRALAELNAIRHTGDRNGTGIVGEVRLALRMLPVGEPLRDLLA